MESINAEVFCLLKEVDASHVCSTTMDTTDSTTPKSNLMEDTSK